MDNLPLDPLEQQLSTALRASTPDELRTPVLAAVRRQLAAQRWERRLGRVAAGILALGIGLNWTVSWHDRETPSDHAEIASTTDPRTIVEVAVAIGNVTDAETGSQLARQLTALTGAPLNPQQAAALEQEVQRRVKGGFLGRKEGSS